MIESKQRTWAIVCCALAALMLGMHTSALRANEELDRYIAMLDATDAPNKIAAAKGVASFRHNAGKAVVPMTKLLEDTDIAVRLAALNAFAAIGIYAKRAIPALEQQLSYRDPLVRYYAAVALDRTGSPTAIAQAAPILANGPPRGAPPDIATPRDASEKTEGRKRMPPVREPLFPSQEDVPMPPPVPIAP